MTKQSEILLTKQNEAAARLVKALGYIDLAKNVLNKDTFKSNLEITKKLDELAAQIRDDIRVHEGNAALLTRLGKKSAQYRRDEIVAQAKRDVFNLSGGCDFRGYLYFANDLGCYAELIVNREKRTVVVLLRDCCFYEVSARGIAKCAPGDCFNVHIGKAIALRRALGLPVPDEYLNAPQPTEVRVGDVIKYENGRVAVVDDERFLKNLDEFTCIRTAQRLPHQIIDDSRKGAE